MTFSRWMGCGALIALGLSGCIEHKTEYTSVTVNGEQYTITTSFTEDEFMDTVDNLRRHVIVNGKYVDCSKRSCREAIQEELDQQEEARKQRKEPAATTEDETKDSN